MAECSKSAQDFIQGAFPAMVGALASEDAESLCQKNGLSFVELIRPFCQLDAEAQIHDPVAPTIVIPIKKLKIRVIDIQSGLPADVLVNRVLAEVVNRSIPKVNLNSQLPIEKQVDAATPWYEAYRDCFFQLLKPSNHEFLRDFLACILVVSTKHPDPMNAFAALSTKQNNMQYSTDRPKSYRWFNNSTFKYYLLLHDASEGEDAKAEAVYQSMKSVYGSHTCFLLQINSRQKMYPESTNGKMNVSDPWTPHIYPFNDDTLDIDETETETIITQPVQSQKDADIKEEAIVNELESIEKQLEENQGSPRSLSFNDPLTSMHYNDDLSEPEIDALGPISNTSSATANSLFRPRKLSERSVKIQEYKKTLQQFSYSTVTQIIGFVSKKERGQSMTLMDQDKIKAFVYEFIVRGLLPHIEKLMRSISEQILARRGIHKSIFNATKKWFGASKQPVAVGSTFNSGSSYTNDSPEVQYRKLGDLAFLVQHYELAYNSYHSAKRDFNNDHAWLYFAGALEMAAISAFLLNSYKVYPVHYFEACISTYLNTCRQPDFATRACFMSTEALKSKAMYPEAAVDFFTLSRENSDLRSALMLEQAAHCFLHSNPPMFRKYAFNMVLAGHRYTKSSQRKHTLRCYINALQVYENKGWHLAEDHVNFIIGRQSFNLGNLDDAQRAREALLSYESQQPLSQQASHLREFLAIFKQNLDSRRSQMSPEQLLNQPIPLLGLPKLEPNSIRCLLHMPEQLISQQITNSPGTPTSRQSRTIQVGAYTFQKNFSKSYINRWSTLEQKIVQFVTGDLPYPFKPYSPCLSSQTINKNVPIIGVEEQFSYEVLCVNPLKISLNLLDLTLLWEFVPADDTETVITNKDSLQEEYIWAEVISNFHIKPAERKPACIRICAKVPGQLKVIGLKYILSSISVINAPNEKDQVSLNTFQENALAAIGVSGMQYLEVKGPRLNSSKKEKATVMYGVDKRLEPKITSNLPLLQVQMRDIPVTLLCGEVQKGSFNFKNIGQVALTNLHIICSRTQCLSFGKQVDLNHRKTTTEVTDVPHDYISVHKNNDNDDIIKIPLENNRLEPNVEIDLPVFVYGLDNSGVHEIDFLFYYEPVQSIPQVPYRLLQQMVRIQTLSTLSVNTDCHVTCNVQDDDEGNSDKEIRSRKEDLLISLTIENRSQGSMNLRCVEFSLKELVCYSTQWKVQCLVDIPKENFKLRPGESCLLHLKASPISPSENTAKASHISLFDEEQEHSVNTSSVDLFMKSANNVEAIMKTVGLILFWETFYIDEGFTRNVINGQSHVALRTPTQELQQNFTTVAQQNLNIPVISPPLSHGITITYEYDSVVEHDFEQNKLCMVAIRLKCSNRNDYDVELEYEAVDLYDDDSRNTENDCYNCSSDIVHWGGNREGTLTIPSNSFDHVTLHGLFSTIGVYEIQNMNVYKVSSAKGHVEKLALMLPKSHFISIVKTTNISE